MNLISSLVFVSAILYLITLVFLVLDMSALVIRFCYLDRKCNIWISRISSLAYTSLVTASGILLGRLIGVFWFGSEYIDPRHSPYLSAKAFAIGSIVILIVELIMVMLVSVVAAVFLQSKNNQQQDDTNNE